MKDYLCILMLLLMSYRAVSADDQGRGRLNMQGSIMDAACAIDVGSQRQLIEIEAISIGTMIRDSESFAIPFNIKLSNCSLTPDLQPRPDWSSFRITFDGPTTGDGLFSVNGGAKGIGLKISDKEGIVAIPGQAMQPQSLKAGSMLLGYKLRLVGDKSRLEAGEYDAFIRFKIDYF
ncbi:fimbrial protein [Citrobacter sp. FP75]|uniref:fimbrial protein n=1 Tax=Citrobacter sp. FP75 TaxID=1852949 RepID=UPI001BC9F525|nr:fimbrial protein [Citrobacter sp. FP75]